MERPSYPGLTYNPYNDANQYIIPNAEPGHQRGRFELAFSQIGGSVLTGTVIGGTFGTLRGYKSIKELPSFTVKRTQMLNAIVKGGTTSANAFGVVALVYSSIGVALSLMRQDDDINTMTAATATGLLTGSFLSAGKALSWQKQLSRSLAGASIGLLASLVYTKSIKPRLE